MDSLRSRRSRTLGSEADIIEEAPPPSFSDLHDDENARFKNTQIPYFLNANKHLNFLIFLKKCCKPCGKTIVPHYCLKNFLKNALIPLLFYFF